MNTTRRISTIIAAGLASAFLLAGCGSSERPLSVDDLKGVEYGGDSNSTTYLLSAGAEGRYITLAHRNGHFGSYRDGRLGYESDFTWDIDDEGVITIDYVAEAETFSAREEKSKTLTAAEKEGVMTLTTPEGDEYSADPNLTDTQELIIRTHVDGRTYRAMDGPAYNFQTNFFDGQKFEWESSVARKRLYIIFEDDSYHILAQRQSYTLVDEEGTVYEWTEAPVYIKKEDITPENIAGTWTELGGGAEIVLTLATHEQGWEITEDFDLYIDGTYFSVSYNSSAKEVRLGQSGSNWQYRSDDARINSLY